MLEAILKLLNFTIHDPDPHARIEAFLADHKCPLIDGPLVDDPYDNEAHND